MSNAKNRELILGRIKQALLKPTEKPVAKPDFQSDLYTRPNEDSAVLFAEHLKKAKASFYFCMDEQDLKHVLLDVVIRLRLKDLRAWEPAVQSMLNDAGIQYLDHDQKLEQCDASVTLCEALVARTGSIFVSSAQAAGRRLTIYPPTHIVVAYTSQLYSEIEDGLKAVKAKYAPGFPSMLSMISGPSRTADIEKTLVLGAHGPKALIVILVDDSSYHP